MSQHESHPQPDEGRDKPSAPPREAIPPFDPRRFAGELRRDAALRIAALGGLFALLVMLLVLDTGGSLASLLAAVVVVLGWVGISVINARVMRELPEVSAMIDMDPDRAEAALKGLLARRPLMQWVRLTLYHRLAVIRHHQGRFVESDAICRHVLVHPLGPGESHRAHLLLLLAESALTSGDVYAAYDALGSLHALRLNLTEYLQKLALQTRYEAMIGEDQWALWALEEKVAMAELMPAPQAGAMHVLLAQSAQRQGRTAEARWLWARAALLCHPHQLEALRAGSLGGGVVTGGTIEPELEPA